MGCAAGAARQLHVYRRQEHAARRRVPRPERARSDEPFSPARLVDRLAATGKTARYIPDTEAIADHLVNAARPGDLIAFLSNGGFGGLQRKLLARLENAT